MDYDFLYPLKFKPILQSKIWGGEKLVSDFYKKSEIKKIGESWEISGVDKFKSIVVNGKQKGKNITALISEFKEDFVGKKIYKTFGDEFPLLFKFIDANENLSIQLHPNDKQAKTYHNSFGKTEMWYVLNAESGSKLYAGFSEKIDRKTYLERLKQGKLLESIVVDEVKKGDAFIIDVGTIHAIGEGILIAEIQQTSDITYRVYDWDRVDSEGKGRELHTELALEALDFTKNGSCKLKYSNELNVPNEIYSCKYFTTNKLNIEQSIERDLSHFDSFVVYMCVEGEGLIHIAGKNEIIKKGETVLIPAITNTVRISSDEKVELLEVYI